MDNDPDLPADRPTTKAEMLAELREALRRDLGILLNTRCRPVSPPAHLPPLADSLVSVGVEDFFSANLVTDEQRQEFAEQLQGRIGRFEPRLQDLSVEIHPATHPEKRSLRLRISARYRARPGMPPIYFETTWDPSTHRFVLRDERAHG